MCRLSAISKLKLLILHVKYFLSPFFFLEVIEAHLYNNILPQHVRRLSRATVLYFIRTHSRIGHYLSVNYSWQNFNFSAHKLTSENWFSANRKLAFCWYQPSRATTSKQFFFVANFSLIYPKLFVEHLICLLEMLP